MRVVCCVLGWGEGDCAAHSPDKAKSKYIYYELKHQDAKLIT